jgi:hypothetical protein
LKVAERGGELSGFGSQGGVNDSSRPPDDFASAFDAASARLREAVAEACARPGPWPARVAAAIYAALEFAADDPAAARLLIVEPWAHGAEAVASRDLLLDHFADLLAAERPRPPGGGQLPPVTEQVLVGGIAGVLTDRLLSERQPPLRALSPELVEFTLLPYLGPSRARLWARRSHLGTGAEPSPKAGETDLVRRAEFTEVLGRLQGMIGEDVQVVINLLEHFFDCGFNARLERVETLAGDDGPVLVVFDGAQGIALDPAELESFVGRWPNPPTSAWIELHIAHRLRLVIESSTESESD